MVDSEYKIQHHQWTSRSNHDCGVIGPSKLTQYYSPATPALGNTTTATVTSGGAYTDTTNSIFEILITQAGTTLAGTRFQWRKNLGTWSADVTPDGTAQLGASMDGVTVTFALSGGQQYVLNDKWLIICTPGRQLTAAMNDGNTIFVAKSTDTPAGNDANAGTAAAPVLTIAHAVSILAGKTQIGIQSDGTWTETLNTAINGLLIQAQLGFAPTIDIQYWDTILGTANIFVDNEIGNDDAIGTISKPLATLARAFKIAAAGTKIEIINDGDYRNETGLTLPAKVRLQSRYYPMLAPIIVAKGTAADTNGGLIGLKFESSSSITFSTGILSQDFDILFCKFTNCNNPIRINTSSNCQNLNIKNNYFTNCTGNLFYCPSIITGPACTWILKNNIVTNSTFVGAVDATLRALIQVNDILNTNPVTITINNNIFNIITEIDIFYVGSSGNAAVDNINFLGNIVSNTYGTNTITAAASAVGAVARSGTNTINVTWGTNDFYNLVGGTVTTSGGCTVSHTPADITSDPLLFDNLSIPKSNSPTWENGSISNIGVEWDDYLLIKSTAATLKLNGIYLKNEFEWGYCVRGKCTTGVYLQNCEIIGGAMGVFNPDSGLGLKAYIDKCIFHGAIVNVNISKDGCADTLIYNTRSDYSIGEYIASAPSSLAYQSYLTIAGFNIGIYGGSGYNTLFSYCVLKNIVDVQADAALAAEYSCLAIYNSNVTVDHCSIVDPLFNNESTYDYHLRSRAGGYRIESSFLNYSLDDITADGVTVKRDIGAYKMVRAWTYDQWSEFNLPRPFEGMEESYEPALTTENINLTGNIDVTGEGFKENRIIKFDVISSANKENIKLLYANNYQSGNEFKIRIYFQKDTYPNLFVTYKVLPKSRPQYKKIVNMDANDYYEQGSIEVRQYDN